MNKHIVKLALPMAGTQVIMTASGFFCMTLLAQFGQDVLAACALIFSASTAILFVGLSLLLSLGVLIGQSYGAKDDERIGCIVQHGWLCGIIISIPMMVLFWQIYPILIYCGQEPKIAKIAAEFFPAQIWRVIPFMISICNQQFCYSIQKPKIDMYANLTGVVILVMLGFYLIPKWGVRGFSYALLFQGYYYLIYTFICFHFMSGMQAYKLFQRASFSLSLVKQLWRIGWPITVAMSGEMLSFLVCALFMGWLGVVSLSAYQVLIQYQFLIVIPILAIAQASCVLVGQAVGSQNKENIVKIGQTSMRLSVCLSVIIGIVFVLFPVVLAAPYLDLSDPQNQPLLELVVKLFQILAIAQVFDAIRNTLFGTLRGMADTKIPMLIGIGSVWGIGIPLAYVFAFPGAMGATGILWAMLLSLLVGMLGLWYRWRRMIARV